MIKRLCCLALMFVALLGLAACEPTVFGVPQSQWKTLTKSQQAAVIKGYNERQATRVANEPYYAAINASQSLLEASKQ